jgi:hypothetical protein
MLTTHLPMLTTQRALHTGLWRQDFRDRTLETGLWRNGCLFGEFKLAVADSEQVRVEVVPRHARHRPPLCQGTFEGEELCELGVAALDL